MNQKDTKMSPREKMYNAKTKKLLLALCRYHELDCEGLTKPEISQKLAERDEKEFDRMWKVIANAK